MGPFKKFLAAENTHNHAGTCPGDTQHHTLPHLFGSALVTGAFNHFIEPLLYKTMQVHEN